MNSTTSPLPQGDAYDPAKMDFKPGPAKVGGERHTGPFASGSALSMNAAVKPLAIVGLVCRRRAAVPL